MGSASLASRYHDATRHHFHRFARSLGFLDWATQPDPFRRYRGAPLLELPRAPLAGDVPYRALYDGTAAAAPPTLPAVAEFLRCAMGLSAWKQYGASRWALRVNPSSGNLHPTEAYVVWDSRVWHYAPREHALEERCRLASPLAGGGQFLVGLTTIHWREAWKYGERAFRYCQHDTGHAIAALRLAAAMLGWRMTLLPDWSHAEMGALLGVDRDGDFGDAEREEAECLAVVAAPDTGRPPSAADAVAAARNGIWTGAANRLSADRVEWPLIDEVAAATRHPGGSALFRPAGHPPPPEHPAVVDEGAARARSILLQRRSAVAFDPRGVLQRDAFLAMLRRLHPPSSPWDVMPWAPQVHLAMFVHRVQDMAPGVYAYLRDPTVLDEWRAAMRPEFLWERIDAEPLFLLVPIDCQRAANRVSCDQDIAADGFFSLGMIARFAPALGEHGDPFYRRLFWECGVIGQVLYLEAEAAGARATGIGCYYDNPVHELLGLTGDAWQSLYHFSMGLPIEDSRLTTEPGYPWESTIQT